jgi:hypothetical protein
MTRSISVASALFAAALGTACYVPEARHTAFRQEWPGAQVQKVEVRGSNGRIEIEAAPVDRVTMEARIRTRDGRSVKPHDVLAVKLDGSTLTIRERGSRGTIFSFGKKGRQIDLKLLVPARMEIDAETVNGRVVVEGVAAAMKLGSVNGRIELSTPGAEVEASTVNGSIRAEFHQRFVGAKLSTVNGSIGVEVPSNASLDLDIHQVNGSFRTDLPVVVESTGGRGSHGSLHGGQYPLEINTVNGSVRLRQADVHAAEATKG